MTRLRKLGFLVATFIALVVASDARGDGVAMLLVSKSLPEATVAVIDPESGTSSGGGGTDVRLAPGDVILFRFNFFPVPENQIHGINGWLTEYIPENTRVVGVRLIDANGNTVIPRYPGLASNDCGATCNGFNSVPSATGTRNLDDGSIAQVYADTGVFYTTSTRLNSNPASAFLTFRNGISMSPAPRYASSIASPLGTSSPFFTHNAWDWAQTRAFGSMPSASGNNGSGNTPHLYGSPVAGPQTHYRFEASETATSAIQFNDAVGPWNRIVYPGSTIGTGSAVTGSGSEPTRMVADASTLGADVTPRTPLPTGTRAIRYAMGEIRVGEPLYAEIALQVTATPIDSTIINPETGMPGLDANCAESFGGDISARTATTRAKDNPWGFHLPAPGCVFLNLLFDLTNDRPLATGGDTITFTLRTRNLSTRPQTNAVVIQKFDSTRVSYTGVCTVPGALPTDPEVPCAPMPTVVPNCEGDGQDCLTWAARDYAPSAQTIYKTRFTVGGGGQRTHVMRARFTSTRLPSPGFVTQSVHMIADIGVADATLAYTGTSTAPGGTAPLSGDVGVIGTNNISYDRYIPVLPAGWTVTNTGGATTPDIMYAGARLECSANCATNRPEFNLADNVPAGARRTVSFSVNVPAGTMAGLYPIEVSLWGSQTAYGGLYETYFRRLAIVAVGQPRNAVPTIDCPHPSTVPVISGTATPGATVTVYINGIARGTDVADAMGLWSVDVSTTFGTLYGGVEIRATADGGATLESVLSATCEATSARECSDGLDNDGDGRIDFPADPGCSGPNDSAEADPQCNDGLDNDGDGDRDWPADLECTSPDDTTEGGPTQCNDGVDNDGDGVTDTADPDCTSATDRTEATLARCMDGADNDGDGLRDFPADPGCHSSNDEDETNVAVTMADIRARFLVVFDTSGSMNWNTCDNTFTGGDGSMECAGNDVSCAACGATGCGNGLADDSRLFKAKSGVSDVIAAYGEVEYSLMRFHQRVMPFSCPTVNASLQSGGWQGAFRPEGATTCGGGFSAGDLLVGFSPENQYDFLEWLDNDANYPSPNPPPGTDIELRGSGTTPIAGSLDSARAYLTSTAAGDAVASCRPYRVILLTDGIETCGGDPVGAATALRTAGFPVYVVGFAVSDPTERANLNAIASAGGTTTAIFVSDETTLSAALSSIIADTVLVETCNGIDDDCDFAVDEGFTLYCNRPSGVTTPSLCGDPGERVCDGLDDNCNGRIDEGLLNACGTCGPVPTEVCDRIDNDCDGIVDEGGVCGTCVPSPEICDNLDNDCDSIVDEGVTRACGTDVGACTVGTQTCVAGVFGTCTGITPTTETCNGIDDDCDGAIDGITRPCGTDTGECVPGTEVCTGGGWGMCMGGVGPRGEVCNNLDDDCDGAIDDGNPGGGGGCGTSIGACSPGTYTCMAGTLVCTGGTGPTPETCNNVDDDCDGAVDDGIPTAGSCGSAVGDCRPGVLTCIGGSFTCTGATGPTAEICDGSDDDCDGLTDEGNPGGGAACGSMVGTCTRGTTTCVGGRLECLGGTPPSAELCNSLDDDCDGVIDEGNPEGGGACGATDVGMCEFGAYTCVDGMLRCTGERGPTPELCDGADNDCDGMIDEGNPEGGVPCGDDTGECMAGTTRCIGGSLMCEGGVGPIEEVCNGLDDDCDGVADDGIPVGAACGTDVGECSPGRYICMDGMLMCTGGIDPIPELCDTFDNDCDGAVDEELPLGGACGTDEGACRAGMLQCVGGREVCVGEIPPSREVCDCIDNDCDGNIDEEPGTGSLCPGTSSCVACQCAAPCEISEFGPMCPTGRDPYMAAGSDMCWCIEDPCDAAACAMETVMSGTTVRCAPDDPSVGACVCRDGTRCTFPCDGVVCSEGLVCNRWTGTCAPDDCRGNGCAEGELCNVTTGECVADACLTTTCGAGEACRGGTCEPSCATVTCGGGERCEHGLCVTDLCADVSCGAGEVCDPADGTCGADMCAGGITCEMGTMCNPVTGECDMDPCWNVHCPEGQLCEAGECALEMMPMEDGGMPDMDSGMPGPDSGMMRMDAGGDRDAGPTDDPEHRILASGGGGCICTVPGSQSKDAGSGGGAAALIALVIGLVAWRRRRAG